MWHVLPFQTYRHVYPVVLSEGYFKQNLPNCCWGEKKQVIVVDPVFFLK